MTLCIPEASGVPGLYGQPPTWPGIDALNGHTAWQATGSYSTPRGVDDPRWQGHLSIGWPSIEPTPASCCGGSAPTNPGFGGATNEDVLFRVLYDSVGGAKFLYLSWWVKADDVNSLLDDAVHVGFTRASGSAILLRITPSTSTSSVFAGPVGPVTISTVPATGGAVTPWTENGGATPSWIAANTHAWVDSVSHRWAVQMRIPIGAGSVDTHLDLADTFKMWFEVSVELPAGLVAPYSWPRDACVVDVCGIPSATRVPSPADWGDFHLSTGPGDPACTGAGFVRLTVADVGTQNTPASAINLTSGNTFEAKPTNLTGGTVNPGEITADFRIADWGSVADPAAPWSPIPATGGTSNPATNTGSITNGNQGLLSMQWQLSAAERAGFQPSGLKSRHQCILVTLSGAHVFNPASVWRNMDFVSASRFARDATISNVGLGASPSAGAPRPAYILIEKLNMPPLPGEEEPQPEPEEPRNRRLRAVDDGDEGGDGNDGGDGNEGGDDNECEDDYAVLVRAVEDSGDPNDRLEQQPMIRYHVYHDTGLDITRDSRTVRVVRPGTAFGYFVDHEGPMEGWRDEVVGATAVTERFFRLDVPEEGTARISTVIEALEEHKPDDGPGGCNALARLWRLIRRLIGWLRP